MPSPGRPSDDDCRDILTPAEAAEVLDISPRSVRVTMNRQGFTETRGYWRSEVETVRDTRKRRRRRPADHSPTPTEET